MQLSSKIYTRSILSILLLFILFGWSCQPGIPDNGQPVETRVEEKDFEEEKQVSFQLADGFEFRLWAPGPLLSNAVALSFDHNGVAYVSETSRRKTSDLDIRQHRDWMLEDLALSSLEDTEAFHKKKLDPALSDENDWLDDFNQDSIRDWRDLMVQSEYIRRIWDEDGDGRADVSALFADGFNDMLTGIAAGIMYHDKEVYLTAAPDVWRIKDLDGDGDADEKTSISHGFGIHIAYAGHDMSGLTMGPDGKVYWSIGDIGVNVVDDTGKRWAYPNQGAVMRCNPDGSDFEVFAHGLRNPQELAFDDYGNLISVDNDGDHPGEHERFVHILEGSDSGWRINWQFGKYNKPNEEYKVWMDERLHIPHFSGQAAFITPPLALAPDGPAGLAYNPGTGLGSKWKGYFFGSYFKGTSARSKIEAFKLKTKGASFELAGQEDIVTGIVPTGVNFGPDGALYINDWKDGYELKPQGRIWRLDLPNSDLKEERLKTQQLIKEGMSERSAEELQDLLGYADQRVRLSAQFELVKRKDNATLLSTAQSSSNELARLHSIWGLGQLIRQGQQDGNELLSLLKDDNEQVRAQTAKVLGDGKILVAYDALVAQLKDSDPFAQYFAAEALGKLGKKEALPALVNLLAEIEENDPHMRHGLAFAMSRLNDDAGIAALSSHPSKFVRIGAVVALRTMASPLVANFLEDEAPLVVIEAARAINDDWSIPDALPALAKALERTEITEEAFVRRAINANLRLGGAEQAQRLMTYATDAKAPVSMRQDALWALGYWPAPPVLDRIDNRYRPLPERDANQAQLALAGHFSGLLAEKNTPIKIAVVEAVGRVKYAEAEPQVFDLLKDKSQAVQVHIAALGTLAQIKSPNIEAALNIALSAPNPALRERAQNLLGELELPQATVVEMLNKALDNGTVPEQQQALSSLAQVNSPKAEAVLAGWFGKLTNGSIAPELQLDVLMAIDKSSFEKLKAEKATFESNKEKEGPVAAFESTMYGGNPRLGGRIFYRNNTAQCIRCHKVENVGGAVGPELTNIAAQLSREQLLESLIEPSARIAPGYGTVILKLKNGEEKVGVLMSEDAKALTLKEGADKVVKVLVEDISARETLPSGMFSMKDLLPKDDIRDLMAFLVLLKADKSWLSSNR